MKKNLLIILTLMMISLLSLCVFSEISFVEPTDSGYINKTNIEINVSAINSTNITINIYNSTNNLLNSSSYVQNAISNLSILGSSLRVVDVSINNKYIVYGTQSNGFYFSNNSGSSFTNVIASGNYGGVAISDSGQYVLACKTGTSNTTYLSTDYGETFNPISNTSCRSSEMSQSGQYVFLGGYNTGIIKYSDDYGSTFSDSDSATGTWTNIKSYNGSLVYATMYNGYPAKSEDYGATWTNITELGINQWYSVDFTTNGNFIIVSGSDTTNYVKYSNDSGTNWYNYTNLGLISANSISMNNNGKIMVENYASATTSYPIVSYDYGLNWQNYSVFPPSPYWFNVFISKNESLNDYAFTYNKAYKYSASLVSNHYFSSNYNNGIYYYNVSVLNQTNGIVNSLNQNVTIDTIKPPKITNLTNTELTYNSATWTWLNASDYGSVDIYLNSAYQQTTTGLTYSVTGLTQNSDYSISIYTFDLARNGNQTAVTSSVTTSKNHFQAIDGIQDVGSVLGNFVTGLVFGVSPSIIGIAMFIGVIVVFGVFIAVIVILLKRINKK